MANDACTSNLQKFLKNLSNTFKVPKIIIIN